jgi:hypothetical protein
LLHRSNEATVDFKKAFELLDKNDKVSDDVERAHAWRLFILP